MKPITNAPITLDGLVAGLDGSYLRGRAAGMKEAAKLLDDRAAQAASSKRDSVAFRLRAEAAAIRALAEKDPT